MDWSHFASVALGAIVGSIVSALITRGTVPQLIRESLARTTGLIRESLVKWEREKTETEEARQQEAALQNLVAECEDNIHSLKEPGYETTPLVGDMWGVHKGRLSFLHPILTRDLRAAYADIFRINGLVAEWRAGKPGGTAQKATLKKRREELAPHL